MPRLLVTHAVVDIDRWLAGKAERAAQEDTIAGWSDLRSPTNRQLAIFDMPT